MRFAPFVALVSVCLIGVQCSSSSSDDSPGGAGTQAGGSAGVGGTSRAGAGGKGNAGTLSAGGASNAGDTGTSAAGSGEAQGGRSDASEAGTGGASTAGDGGMSDAGAPSAAGAAGQAGDPDARPPIAHFGQVRFVNLAPNSVALDFCMKLSSAGTYTSAPILGANAISAGVPFANQTKYVDLPLTFPTAYDFVVVAGSATTCDAPWLAAFGSATFSPDTSSTIAIFQSTFPSANNYSAALFNDGQGQAPRTGNVRLFYAANVLSSAIDFHALRPSAADETWYSDFKPGFGSGFHAAAVATYEFRATAAGTQTVVADKTGVVVASDDPSDLFLYQSGAAQQALLGCPSKPASAVAPCTR